MARQSAIAVENNFSKGLITEATGLNFPENACVDTENCIFERTGTVSRRPGIDHEAASDPIDISAEATVTEFLWKGAAQSGEISFAVVQVGEIIRFFDTTLSGTISLGLKDFVIVLNDYASETATDADLKENPCSFASGNGLLFVAHPFCDSVYVEYFSDTDTIETTKITLKVRDVGGVPNIAQDTGALMEVNHRPSNAEFGQNVYYNLLNQGWYINATSTSDGRRWGSIPPLLAWRTGSALFPLSEIVLPRTDWPSEADTWYIAKSPIIPLLDGSGNPIPPTPPAEGFYLNAVDKVDMGNAPTGKGHFILDALAEDRYSAAKTEDEVNNRGLFDGLGDLIAVDGDLRSFDKTSGKHKPSQVAFFASRVWYAGINAKDYNTKIYFTQILENKAKNVDKCYQSQDPTSETSSDLLPTDGGVIIIPDIARVVKLFLADSSMYVFSTNGIWRISGSAEGGLGFTANDYAITRVSDIGTVSTSSFVDVEGVPLWWNNNGIWTFKNDRAEGLKVVSLSLPTIETYVNRVPPSEITYIKAAYDPLSKIVQFLFRDTISSTVTERHTYSHILNLDTATGTFYPWTVSTNIRHLAGVMTLLNVPSTVDPGATVASIFKYLVITDTNTLGFADTAVGLFKDWASEGDPVPFTSHLISGYKVRGQALNKFQSNVLRVFSNLSTFDVQGRWDYAISDATGKWTSLQRIITNDALRSYESKRLKIRGQGLALQFKISSVDDYPFTIIGWSTLESGNEKP